MTNVTHTAPALLLAAVTTLETLSRDHKKQTGAALLSLTTDCGNGITFRELKAWAKEFRAKTANIGAKAPEEKAPVKAATTSAKADAAPAALKGSEVKDQVVLRGRYAETVTAVVRDNKLNAVVAKTAEGSRILLADIERNNRGNLRIKLDRVSDYPTPGKAAPTQKADSAPKAPAATVKAAPAGKYPVRDVVLKKSTNLQSAQYDRNNKTLTVSFKSGNVYSYADVSLKDVRELEEAESSGKHFNTFIKAVKTPTKHGAIEVAPVKETKAPKAPAQTDTTGAGRRPKNPNEVNTPALRAAGFMNGRTAEKVRKIFRDDNDVRIVRTDSGKDIPLLSIVQDAKGKFHVSDLSLVSEAVKAGGKSAKADKAPKGETAPVKSKVEARPSIKDVKARPVRVTSGRKELLVDIKRVVSRDNVRYALTANDFPLVFDLIVSLDGQLTYTGKMDTASFRAL